MLQFTCAECYHKSVQIKQGITPKYFLDALRTGGTFGNYRGANIKDRESLIKAKPEVYQAAQRKVAQLLRRYLDEWLDTGFKDEIEQPSERKLLDTKSAGAAVQTYCANNPPLVLAADEGLFALFGGPRIKRGFKPDAEGNMMPQVDDPLADAAEEAARLFTLLMDVPWRDRVYKCRRCGEYGYLSRKPLLVYKRGIHCAKCRNKATAEASSEQTRKDQKDERLKLAADVWQRWKQTYGIRNTWVAQQVNDRLRAFEDHITGKWVTRNIKEIEREIKLRSK